MGYEDIGDFSARANNGLFTDAYYNFGMIGVVIFSIIVVVILKILDGSVFGLSEKFFYYYSKYIICLTWVAFFNSPFFCGYNSTRSFIICHSKR